MSEGAPTNWLPRLITPRKLAYSGGIIAGNIEPAALSRLVDATEFVDQVKVELGFSISEEGKLLAVGNIEARLGYECQRCLQAMEPEHKTAELNAAIVRNEEEAKELPKRLEPWIVEGEEADLYAYIEEELLLALPVVAYHSEQCIDPSLMQSGEPDAEEQTDKVKDNPFSVLSTLKGKNSDE